MKSILATLLVVVVCVGISATKQGNGTRSGKVFSIFQIVNFPNDPCIGSASRNGTCYTLDECNSRGGSSSGTCAQGFGVCCVFSLACGGTTSENCTYLIQSGFTIPASDPCAFTICKCSSNICRIRLDFTTFSIAGPVLGSVDDDTTADPETITTNGGAIGDCTSDTFSVTAPGNPASPVICGFNTGQHMILDASDECHIALFDFSGASVTRQFDIKVTQYACGDETGGPDGCLQYFTGNAGTFASFNFPTEAATLSSTVTHLSNQCYTICFRQEHDTCGICFTTVNDGTITQGSFGLSISSEAISATGVQDSKCSEDYLQIPGAERGSTFEVGSTSAIFHTRICGRFFTHSDDSGVGGMDNSESICTQQRPFRIHFKTDANENTLTIDEADMNEQVLAPGGILGFNLNYALQDC